VDATRHWFPEQKVLPNARGIDVTLGGVAAGALNDPDQGWSVSAVAG